ncbi:hypothetical protein MBLNU230_g4307t1 [Neophaeotheca triangularis]
MVKLAEDHVVAPARELLEANEPPSVVATKVGLSKRTIARWRLCFELSSTVYAPSGVVHGKPRIITTAQEDWKLKYLGDRPTAYLEEICLAVWDELGIDVSKTTVFRVLKRRTWSYKVAKRTAKERN